MIFIEYMDDQQYLKRELDTKFETIMSLVHESVKDIQETLSRIETQTVKTNGRVNTLETRESERRGASKWVMGIGAFTASILVSYLAWLGSQVINIHSEVQQAVADALAPYAK